MQSTQRLSGKATLGNRVYRVSNSRFFPPSSVSSFTQPVKSMPGKFAHTHRTIISHFRRRDTGQERSLTKNQPTNHNIQIMTKKPTVCYSHHVLRSMACQWQNCEWGRIANYQTDVKTRSVQLSGPVLTHSPLSPQTPAELTAQRKPVSSGLQTT